MAQPSAYTDYPTTFRDVCSFKILDGTAGTALYVAVTFWERGSITIEPNRDLKVIYDNDTMKYCYEGDATMNVSFTIPFGEFTGTAAATDLTPYEAITGTGRCSDTGIVWTTTHYASGAIESNGQPKYGLAFAVDLEFKVASPVGVEATAYEKIEISSFIWDGAPWTPGDDYTTWTVSGMAYGASLPTVTHYDTP